MPSTNISDSERSFSARYEVGDLIGGKYELLRKAGEGAMGTVWVANNRALDLQVALKLIKPEIRSPAIDVRLLREARAVAMLSHSAIVRIFDRGETHRGDPYIVMELLDGESLGHMLQREKRMSPERAISLLLPVASAISAAHERGVVHRDLKPDNIMLAQGDGDRIQPKVVDFGVAKLTWVGQGNKSTGTAMIGTPDYMSPEQALTLETADHRVDIWAFCAMLYELISGSVPFASGNAFRVLCAVVQSPVRSLVERCGTDPELWAIIERGLRKDPAERWGSMRELGEALAAWLLAQGVQEDVCGSSLRAQWPQRGDSQHPQSSTRQAAWVPVSVAPVALIGVAARADGDRTSAIRVRSAREGRAAADFEQAPSVPFPLVPGARAEALSSHPALELALQKTLQGGERGTSHGAAMTLRGRLALATGILSIVAVTALAVFISLTVAGRAEKPGVALARMGWMAPCPAVDRVGPLVNAVARRATAPVNPVAVAPVVAPMRAAAPAWSEGLAAIAPRTLEERQARNPSGRWDRVRPQKTARPQPDERKAAAVPDTASAEAPSREVHEGNSRTEARPVEYHDLLTTGSEVKALGEPSTQFSEHGTMPATSQADIQPEPR